MGTTGRSMAIPAARQGAVDRRLAALTVTEAPIAPMNT
jgi:hypothetical protein